MKCRYSYDSLYVMNEERINVRYKELEEGYAGTEFEGMAGALWPHNFQSLNISSGEKPADVLDFINQLVHNSACDPDLYIKNIKFEIVAEE